VADHQFDGSGKRFWREVTALLDSERARMRVGQVAIPYDTCTEPSNVQPGGSACPFRFHSLGCGHATIRTRSCCSRPPRLHPALKTVPDVMVRPGRLA
jgi:hypothetical protein